MCYYKTVPNETLFGGGRVFSEADKLILSEIFLFKGMNEEDILEFAASNHTSLHTFKKGEILAPNEDKRLGILLSGKAVALPFEEGNGAIKTFLSGELFGAASCFCEECSSPLSNIVAKTACRVLFISREAVEELFRQNPESALEYIRFLSGRVEFLNRRISTFTSKETLIRVTRYLLKTADEKGVSKNINFSALAKSLGISRASLYRAKAELVNSGAVSVDGKSITLLDPDALKNI